MKLFKKILAAGLVAAMSLSVMGCGGKDETANSDDVISAGETEMTNDSQSDESSTGGVITFGTNAEFPPFEYVSSNGVIDNFDGIDMAIAKEIASQNGSTAAIVESSFTIITCVAV